MPHHISSPQEKAQGNPEKFHPVTVKKPTSKMFNAIVLAVCALSAPHLASAAVAPEAAVSVNSAYLSATDSAFHVGPRSTAFIVPFSMRRAATASDLVGCETNADCLAIDKNGICGSDSTCQCKDGYHWDTDHCAKTTKAICDSKCAGWVEHSVCKDVAKLSCQCDPVGYKSNETNDGCVEYTKDQCDADCAEQEGAGWSCDPTDYSYCVLPTSQI